MRYFGRRWTYDWEDLPKLPPEQKKYSSDKKRMVVWYECKHNEDAYDDDTDWEIVVWDVATKKRVKDFLREHSISHSTGAVRGGPLNSVDFGADASEIVIIQGGKEFREKLPD